jgi:hypothetical protein
LLLTPKILLLFGLLGRHTSQRRHKFVFITNKLLTKKLKKEKGYYMMEDLVFERWLKDRL